MREAAQFYREFLSKWPDDPLLKSELANALRSLAEITELIGTADETVDAWQEASKAAESLLREAPDHEEMEVRVYQCYFHAANGLVLANRLNEAIAAYESVRTIVLKLNEKHPDEMRFRRDLGACSGSLGNCCLRQDQPGKAAVYYREAEQIFEKLFLETPGNGDLRLKLVTTRSNLAMCIPAEEQIPVLEGAREILLEFKRHAAVTVDGTPPGQDRFVARYRTELAREGQRRNRHSSEWYSHAKTTSRCQSGYHRLPRSAQPALLRGRLCCLTDR